MHPLKIVVVVNLEIVFVIACFKLLVILRLTLLSSDTSIKLNYMWLFFKTIPSI